MKLPFDDDTNKLSDFRGLLEKQKQVTYDPDNPDSMYATKSGKFEENPSVFSRFRVFGGGSNNNNNLKSNNNVNREPSPRFDNDMMDEKMNDMSLNGGDDQSIDTQSQMSLQSKNGRPLGKKNKEQRFWMSDKNCTQCSECGATFHTFRRKQLSEL